MASKLKLADLQRRIDWALRQANCGDDAVPVDLESLCKTLGIEVEWRWMIPEGVMVHSADKLRICLQSNFRNRQRISRRQRFTWAHEICHGLFYDPIVGAPCLIPGAPKGPALEKMCQRGAAYLLVPSNKLAADCTPQRPVSSMADLENLSNRYDVSLDVLLRRLHEVDRTLQNDYALLLVRSNDGNSRIDAAAYGPWLRAYLDVPVIGESFEKWAGPILHSALQISDDAWKSVIGDQELTVVRKTIASGEIVELRLGLESHRASSR
jgi:Zn-dependent peptidase ImmA (M78 family)